MLLAAGWLWAGAALPAGAETLQQALALAYGTNPVLRGQRAMQRATGETVEQARSGWRPVVGASVSAGYQREPYDTFNYAVGTIETNDAQAALTVTQPLYTGGRVGSAVRASGARTRAARQGVRLAEAQTFQAVIGAYMDVLRDGDILAVRRADLRTLERQVAETTSRYQLGDAVTRTDVAQAEAQRDDAAASLATAEAQLEASRAGYRTAVGIPPGPLLQPDALPGLPATLELALAAARAANPMLAQDQALADASGADIASADAAFAPQVGVQAAFGYIGAASPFRSREYDQEVSGVVTLSQPIYTGGLLASQLRQARDRHDADRDAVEDARRQADQAVLTGWSQMRAGLAAIRADEREVGSAMTALRGYQIEYGYGLRSTLDVLIADQTLRAAQVSLAVSRHDTVVAEAALLAAMGRLEAGVLLAAQQASTG